MSATRTQALAGVRELLDAANSSRWSDAWIKTVLGIVHFREWKGILGANPYYRFAQRSVTTDSSGQFLYTGLNSGSGNTAQTWNRILSITDGQNIYNQTAFRDAPLATTTNYASTYVRSWFDAGLSVQVLPVQSGLALTVSVNYTPTRIDNLALDADSIDFPDGSEVILYLEAAAILFTKGNMESDAAQTMKALADVERTALYDQIARRSIQSQHMGMPDSASEWGG